jgi:Raf kinase inhibitor-like YbhB/YbcL family protein
MACLFSILLAVLAAQPAGFVLTSPAFKDGASLPVAYTGYGDFKSPPLRWSGAPPGTREFALVVENLDVPMERFSVHWLLYDIPAAATTLPEVAPDMAAKTHPSPIKGASQGANWMKRIGYLPPRPFAKDGPQRFTFKLYALDADLALAEGATKEQLLAAIKGHVLAESTITAVVQGKE